MTVGDDVAGRRAGLPPELSTLAAGLADPARLDRFAGPRPGQGARAAAVLALVEITAAGPRLALVERAHTLRHHAAQLAFPGGGVEPGDADLPATAVREAGEEVGLQPDGVEVLGVLPPVHVAVSRYDVTLVVAWWRRPHRLAVVDPDEVAAVHLVEVEVLADPATRVVVRHPSGYQGPGFVLPDDLLIWGLTAHLVDGLLELGGWARPWDRQRTAEIPARYLTDRRSTGGPDAH